MFGRIHSISCPPWRMTWFICKMLLIFKLAFLLVLDKFFRPGWQCLYLHRQNGICLKILPFVDIVLIFYIFLSKICYFFASCLTEYCLVNSTIKRPSGFPFSMTMSSKKDLFKIPIHSVFASSWNCFISPLYFEQNYALQWFDRVIVTSVSYSV